MILWKNYFNTRIEKIYVAASGDINKNLNQKLHLYIGAGENGKSVLTDLLSQCLGDYYAIANILITQQRQKQGQASPDIVALED